MESKVQHVFLVGAKSLGAYGGYETFIDKLTEYHQSNPDIKYHVVTKANGQGAGVPDGAVWNCDRYTYHNADCFQIKIPECLGSAQAIYYDCKALGRCVEIIKEEGIEHPIVYVMACRIGPFFNHYVKKIHRLGGRVFLNPDGHEWKRAKWSKLVRAYWKKSEELMVKHSDLIIEALSRIQNKEKYVYVICGSGINGGTCQYLKKMAEEKKVTLYLLGFRMDIPEITVCSDIGAIPSLREGLGFAGVQSLAAGIPVVGTDVQGIRDYILNDKTGYLCKKNDSDAFAEAILLLSDSAKRESMKNDCIKTSEKFDIAASINQRKKIYKEILT